MSSQLSVESLTRSIIVFISTYGFSNKNYFNESFRQSIIKNGFNQDAVISRVKSDKYGICMELNYTFCMYLKSKGYDAYLTTCRKPKCLKKNDSNNSNDIFEYFDIEHVAIIVIIDNVKYFVDVGFGEYFVTPIELTDSVTVNNIEVLVKDDTYYLTKCNGPVNKEIDEENVRPKSFDHIEHDNKDYKIVLKLDMDLITIDKIDKINENYVRFFSSNKNDFPLCDILFERIFDRNKEIFVEAKY